MYVPDYISANLPEYCSLSARGNTIVDFELTGYPYNNPKGLGIIDKYNSEGWSPEAGRSFSPADFSKANLILSDYYIENESVFVDENCEYTEKFNTFRTEFLNFLMKCLKQLRDEKFFESVYSERILVNFEVREYYGNEEMISIFEYLNTKEEAELYSQWLLPVKKRNKKGS